MSKYIIMVFAGASSFGMLSTFVKLANREGYTAAEISFSQAFLGMIFLWALVLTSGKRKNKAQPLLQSGKQGLMVIFTGVAIGLTTFLYYVSVQYITASLAVVILMQFAWMGLLLEWLIFKRKPSFIALIAMLLILGGTVMSSGVVNVNPVVSFKGILCALASAFLYAIYIVANGNVGNNFRPLTKSATIMTGSAAGICIVNAPHLLMHAHLDFNLLKWAALLSVFGTIVPPVLFAVGIPKIGVVLSSMIMTVELPVAILFAHIILKEHLDMMQCIGILVMTLALLMLHVQKAALKKSI